MQSVIFYQVNFLSYLRISIFVKALVNGLALLLDFCSDCNISIEQIFERYGWTREQKTVSISSFYCAAIFGKL